jgi:hypothetical protein
MIESRPHLPGSGARSVGHNAPGIFDTSGISDRVERLICSERPEGDEFLEERFPESRRKAYYLMAIHENLTKIPKQQLRETGWRKAAEIVKVARREGERFDCAPWVHKAKDLNREEFEREVERHLTGQETEPWELIYFKLCKSQLPVIEQALETAALMLGSDKSRGYKLEMICADFLAGVISKSETLTP